MMGTPRFRPWMWLALGSVLVLGLSTGLLADRLLGERGGGRDKRADGSEARAARQPMFHFDCRGSRENAAGAAVAPDPGQDAGLRLSDRLREHSVGATQHLAHRLELDPEQTETLRPIMEAAMVRSRHYWVRARDEFCAMQEEFHRSVGEVLNEEQAARFDAWRSELADRSRRHGGRHRGARSSGGPDSGGCR